MNNNYNSFENQVSNNNVEQQPIQEPVQQIEPQQPVTPVQPVEQVQPTIPVEPQQPKKNKIGIIVVGIIVLAAILVIVKFVFGQNSGTTGTTSTSGGNNKFGGTFVAATQSDTHKGIVYLDPLDLSRTCTAEDAAKNVNKYGTPTERRSGCMKFYIYDDSGDNYTMILDHNTSTMPAYLSFNAYTDDIQGWAGNPRLITANEIAHIVGADKADTLQWDQSKPLGTKVGTNVDWFFLDGSGKTIKEWQKDTTNETNKSKYAWLFDYTANCKKSGCNIEDNNEYHILDSEELTTIGGYWTSSETKGDSTTHWAVLYINALSGSRANNSDNGIGFRPVITLSKKVIEKKESIPNPKKKSKGSNFVKAGSNDTHKGIVYMDPSDLSRTCTAEDAAKNVNENGTPTGIKFGCMKFYIYDDSGDTYKMILDHNISGNTAWGYTDSKKVAVSTLSNRFNVDAKDWQVDVDVISADEVAHIVGIDAATNWSVKVAATSTDGSTWFYLDGSGKTVKEWQKETTNETNKSKYAWLFDYTADCKKSGCNIEDNNKYSYLDLVGREHKQQILGYWAKEGETGFAATYGYNVSYAELSKADSGYKEFYYGIRPVVTIKKNLIKNSD